MDDAFYEMTDIRIKPWLSLTKSVTDIDKCNLLSPLMVIETLAHNSTATLGVVKVIDAFLSSYLPPYCDNPYSDKNHPNENDPQ